MKTYRPWNAEQSYLLPPSPRDWLPEGHLAYFILDIIGELDLGPITRAVDSRDARGEKPYSPVMMVALLLYAYCVGVFSSRRIERATYEDVAFRIIAGDNHPHFSRIADFRRRHLDALAGIFVQTVALCQKAGLVDLGLVAIDGTKVQGNASKHKAMSYARMQAEEKRLREEMQALLQRAEQADTVDDARFGEGQGEEDLPAELRRREDRLTKIREAKKALEREAAAARAASLEEQADAQAEKARVEADPVEAKRAKTRAGTSRREAERIRNLIDDDDEPPRGGGATSKGLPTHRTKPKPDGTPDAKAQHNFTDPDSRIQKRNREFLQGYNCQASVDGRAQVVVAQGVTNQSPDNGMLRAMVELTAAVCGEPPVAAVADSGYWHPGDVDACERHGVDVFIATGREQHGPPSSPTHVAGDDARSRMTSKVTSERGRELYARRKTIVEPVFGQIKEARGFRRFLLRGLRKVEAEWSLVCATHNLLKLFRAGATPRPA